jgi:V8-like Glu-specific endopeptidase
MARVKAVLWSSPSNELDTAVLLLDSEVPGVEPCPVARSLPKPGPDSKVFIIGYPGGGGLSYSLFDNELLGHEQGGARVHYRTPTEPGSSGSPVFNQNWELIAIHHAGGDSMQSLHGSGTYEANEGIQIGAIRQALGG